MVLITYRIEKFLMGRVTFPTWPAAKEICDAPREHGVLPGEPWTYRQDHVNQALLTILFSLKCGVEIETIYPLAGNKLLLLSSLLMAHIVLT